jgi:magnesium transporter
MQGTLTQDGNSVTATRDLINQRLASGDFFWLDLDGIDSEAHDVLLTSFHIHHLAADDAQHFGQRPKVEDYDNFTYMVVHGAGLDEKGTLEVHFIIAEHYVITVHRGNCPPLDAVHERQARRGVDNVITPQFTVLYVMIDHLVDSFFPFLDVFDNQIDDLEDAILIKPTDQQLGTLFDMKRNLISVRKVVTPQRDMFAAIISGVTTIPGVTDEGQRYMRDIYDHLIRISDLVDGYRDLLSGTLDTHLSTVSNRLNVVMKQLTIIATIFLPLTFITGFFGQNFAWLVTRITGGWAFIIFAILFELICAVALAVYFRKKGWLGADSA